MARILIIEDNADLAFGLRNNLEIEGHVVEVAGNGHAGLEAARRTAFDLIVLDLTLPGIDGYRVLQTIREEGSTTPVLILSARDQEADKVLGFRLGADDYVAKPFGVLELLARVDAILRRSAARPDAEETLIRFGNITVDRATQRVTRAGVPVALTHREFTLLVALAERRGAIVRRSDLMQAVWGHRTAVNSRTVDTHIFALRQKLEDDPNQPQHILTVRKSGYRLELSPRKSASP